MYDLIIIGAGSAGISAYKAALRQSQNILIINAGPWDTTCARVGCMPSKILIAAANRLHDAQTAERCGLRLSLDVDCSALMHHVRKLRDHFSQAMLDEVAAWPAEHKISGHARFVDPQTIEVNGQHYQGKSFILAVGSKPHLESAWQHALGDRLITTDQLFELEALPSSMAVIGSGVIALELAQALSRLGVKITLFARSQKVAHLSSPPLQQLAQQIFSQQLDIRFATLPDRMQRLADQVQIEFIDSNGQPETMLVDYVFAATGRDSQLDQLSLAKIDAAFLDHQQLPIDAHSKQLGNWPIFVAGDAYSSTPVQHEAAHEGRELVYNCFNYPQCQNIKSLTALSIVFSEPQLAMVGQSHRQLQQAELDFVSGCASYEHQGRATLLGKNQGAIEVYVERGTERILGAELIAPEAEHLAHLLSCMIAEQVSLSDCLAKPFYHPTLEEGLRSALKDAQHQLRQ